MRWRFRLFLSSVVGSSFLSGCVGEQHTSPPAPGVTRYQKPDTPARPVRAASFLDVLPDQPADATSGEVAARIRATVNGVPIFDEEIHANAYQFLLAIQGLPEPEQSKKRREIYKETLDSLIERELLIQDANARLKKAGPQVMKKLQDASEKEFDKRWVSSMKKNNESRGVKTDDDLKDFLRRQGLSLDMIRRQWTRQFIATEYLRNRVIDKLGKIGHEQLVDFYEQHIQEFLLDDSVEWQDLFIRADKYASRDAARKLAEEIRARLQKGEDFKTLCKQYDDSNSAATDAMGIGKKHGEIQPADCEPHLFGMQPGDIGPIIELPGGYHVFRLVTRVFAGRKPFDMEVQKDIHNKLRAEMYEREVKKIVDDLKRHAVIDRAMSGR